MYKKSLDYNYRIVSAKDIRPAAELFMRLSSKLAPFKISMIDDISSPQHLVDGDGNPLATDCFGWTPDDDNWWNRKDVALEAPIPKAARYECEPFYMDREKIITFQPNASLVDFGHSFGDYPQNKSAAIIAPVRLPFSRIGLASWIAYGNVGTDVFAIYEEYADALMVMALKFLSGYVKIQKPHPHQISQANLSKRETQCLKWVARGKTDSEIAIIIGISHATVRFHVQNAARKLDTVSRAHTVFRATQLGYLSSGSRPESVASQRDFDQSQQSAL